MTIPFATCQFAVYEQTKKFLTPTYSPLTCAIAGGMAGAVGTAVTTPLDIRLAFFFFLFFPFLFFFYPSRVFLGIPRKSGKQMKGKIHHLVHDHSGISLCNRVTKQSCNHNHMGTQPQVSI